MSRLNTTALASALTLLMAGPLAAAETIKIADSLPAEHTITKNTTAVFMEKAKAQLGDKVEFQHFPAEQLGKAKDMLNVTQSGLADIGYVVPSYVSEKMPLGAVAELPGQAGSSCAATTAFFNLAKPGGALDKLEFEPNGVRVLYAVVLSPYQAVFSKPSGVIDLNAFAGKKMRSNPGPMELSLKSVGATPVRMTPPEIFDAISKGTIDGALLPYTSTVSYGLDQVIGSATKGANFGSVGITYAMSLSKWNALDPEVQKVLTEVGEQVTASACAAFDSEEQALAGKLEAGGVKLFEFTPDQKATIEGHFDEIATQWATALDGRGKPGSDILQQFRAALPK